MKVSFGNGSEGNTNSPVASEAADQALRAARRSQRLSATPGGADPRKFTLNRNMARDIRDAQVASSLASWLTQETGITVRGDNPKDFCADLEDGVVFCRLASKFGQVTRYRDPPKNEFQRLENFELFAKSAARMGLSSAPPSSRRDFPLSSVLPCLLEMAVLAQQHANTLEIDSDVPGEVLERAVHPAEEDNEVRNEKASEDDELKDVIMQAQPEKRKDVVVIISLDEEEEDETDTSMNIMLGQLHIERMKRQRAGPPKLRIIDVGGRQLVAIERPGEAIGSIIWQGSIDLVHYLYRQVGKTIFSCDNKGSILELGAGCGVCGIWAACEGGDVVVTDLAPSVDLLWANVAANAQQIVKSGGSCSARTLDFSDGPSVEKLVRTLSTDGPLTIIAADVVYGESVRPLIGALSRIFAARPDTKMYLAYKQRDAFQENVFFESFQCTDLGSGSQPANGEAGCRIFMVGVLK